MDPAYAATYAERYPTYATRSTLPRCQPGRQNGKAWREIEESGQTHCCYCRNKFTRDCRPTFDHKVPRALGGTIEDGFVMACQTCNSLRGDVSYEEYVKAVDEEWRLAKLEGRGYRRPKRIDLPSGAKIVTTLSKKQRQDARVMS